MELAAQSRTTAALLAILPGPL